MAYSFRPSDKNLTAGLRRIAASQIEAGLAELRDAQLPRDETVHQVRKRCKKLRGLIRLVRPGFEGYALENAALRDAAREVSPIRDIGAMLETLDRLEAHFAGQIEASVFAPVRDLFEAKRAGLDTEEAERRLAELEEALEATLERVGSWSVHGKDAEIVGAGMARTYRQAVNAMKTARKTPTAAHMHDWRKQVKYHWYHLRLIRQAWPEIVGAFGQEADHLCIDLGDHHDLAVMQAELSAPGMGKRKAALGPALKLMRDEEARLTAESFERGRRLFAESPACAAERWRAYWQAAFGDLP